MCMLVCVVIKSPHEEVVQLSLNWLFLMSIKDYLKKEASFGIQFGTILWIYIYIDWIPCILGYVYSVWF